MKEFTSSEMQVSCKKILDEALKKPVRLNRRGSPSFVLMTKIKYEQLKGRK